MTAALLAAPFAATADTILWIDDASGNIGQVDVNTGSVMPGSVHNTGQLLTDIAFNSAGTLYGTTFSGLYSINTSTGAATSLGSYTAGGGQMNALVGSGPGLLAASAGTTSVYSVNPGNASTATFATSPAVSAGDLAFNGGTLYEAGVSSNGSDELINVTTNSVVGIFHAGSTNFNSVFGLADDGTTMYAVNGTEVYSVNLSNASLTPLFDYSLAENGQHLGAANGTAFIGEGAPPVPVPSSLTLLVSALLGFCALYFRRTDTGKLETRARRASRISEPSALSASATLAV